MYEQRISIFRKLRAEISAQALDKDVYGDFKQDVCL